MTPGQIAALAPFVAFGLLALCASASAFGAVLQSHRRERALHGEVIKLRDVRGRMRGGR